MVSAASAVAVGMLELAAAMGIGRFVFTPLMSLTQEHAVLTMAHGGWLDGGLYAGYLAGALLCVFANPNPGAAARAGLAGVALLTLATARQPTDGNFDLWRSR